ncbi:hypothetical protein B0A49_00291 [Cryomyces minteri]|uniref:JmjC domain-containing protein n=1 Tax=Cryomyces minteri TaxID=331657 RepID=A0A4U0XZI6_9PEZI|nr:hypothetical protein B0A49_00291 [Cryomyces minteri]
MLRSGRSSISHYKVARQLYPTISRFSHVEPLRNGSVDTFRQQAFAPAKPALLPRDHFRDLPALKKWFEPSPNMPTACQLNASYLSSYGETLVPLELTRDNLSNGADSVSSFEQLHAPLNFFIEWTRQHQRSASASTPATAPAGRLYLAQAQVSDLPSPLRADLPTPALVTLAGKGDVYDANVWIGLAPTYTPLHRDPNPNLFVQLAGRKTVRLFTPDVGADVFRSVQARIGAAGGGGGSASTRGAEMMQGAERRILEAEVWGSGEWEEGRAGAGLEAHLEAGDGLFIPKGWWHSIKGVGEGVTGSVGLVGCLPHMAYTTTNGGCI